MVESGKYFSNAQFPLQTAFYYQNKRFNFPSNSLTISDMKVEFDITKIPYF